MENLNSYTNISCRKDPHLYAMVYMMVLGSVVLAYYVTTKLITDKNNLNSVNKLYKSLYMAFLMGNLELIIAVILNQCISWGMITLFLILSIAAITVFYLARRQVFVNGRDFAGSMINHHQDAIVMAERLLEKNPDAVMKKLAYQIIDSQKREIKIMENYLKSYKTQ